MTADGVGAKQADDRCYPGFRQAAQGDFRRPRRRPRFAAAADQMNVLVDKARAQHTTAKINHRTVRYDIAGDVSADGNNFAIREQNIADAPVFWRKQVRAL